MKNEQVRSNIPKTAVHVSFRDLPADPGIYSKLHYHDELEFLAIYDGEFITVVDDVEYVAHRGDIVFINSGVPHSTYSKTRTRTGLLQFRENDFISTDITKIIKYSVKFNNLSESKIRVITDKELFSAVNRILVEYRDKKRAYEIFIRGEIYRTLGCLYRMNILVDSEQFFATKEIQKILPAIEYVNKNYSEEITLESASAMLGFDPSYFCRIFKSATGSTFTEYLNFVRICKAEKMLSHSQSSILEISETVGFSSVSYFNRVFKKYRNCSPRNYRLAEYKNI